ncbi:activating transcription factor 7-interacting protein 2 isoform X1 [Carassius gibelio]|uniref:activating transcription factor 7-interacting protein 2 isoform X1 n=1 Tax=Carassius gibelio TaxID=101364 RepID=UPI0022791320|nr:activating transcription factor 7-interacting protein 2 isoform X1 [Carassius gibelio]XP_052409128.1 activating transcription factor 7-interacting protein 2 isoform X1 [Carassius gibelio]
MKRSRYEDDSTTSQLAQESGQKANKLPRSEIEKIISDKVVTAVEQSDYKMKNLMERIGEVNGEPRYDARIKNLEAHVRKIKRRGDAVFAYIRKFRSLGISQSQSPSISPSPVQPQRCISPAEPVTNISRSSVNGGCFSDNASVSSADNDCEMTTLRRPKKRFWQSSQSKNQVVDLTEDGASRLNEESPVTQPSDQISEPSRWEQSNPSITPPVAIKEEMQSVTEDRVSSSVQLEEEQWHSKLHPFPDTPFPKELPVVAASYNLPQKPVVKLARIGSAQELGIAWNVDQKDPHVAEMDCYYIYVSHEHKNGTFSGWKCLGEIKAMPLPMACKVSDCKGDKQLCFIVVGKDIFGRYGPYSDIHTVASGQI